MKRIVIGVIGPLAGGKGAFCNFLKERGFTLTSLSDRVREECRAQGLPIGRESLQDMGDRLRRGFGTDVLARRTIDLFQNSGVELIVIESIRNPGEIDLLRKELGAYIVGVTASFQKRFERILTRGRPDDPKTWEEFLRIDSRDSGINQEAHGQQVSACLQLADEIIENETDNLDALRARAEDLITRLGPEGKPTAKERK